MSKKVRLNTPLKEEEVTSLRAGDEVLLNGVIYTARDATHKRLLDLLEKGQDLPFDVKGQIIYYVGPSPAKPGNPIGSCGPTTSYRMDPYAPALMKVGLKGMIGKGPRGKEVIEAMKRHKAVYFAAVGGTAALIARSVKSSRIIAYEDLGTEAIRELEVEDFPVIVANDVLGNDLYEEGIRKYSRKRATWGE
jgi:fumarate hydratase subunit beta